MMQCAHVIKDLKVTIVKVSNYALVCGPCCNKKLKTRKQFVKALTFFPPASSDPLLIAFPYIGVVCTGKTCSGRGTCHRSLGCQCQKGYSGTDCESKQSYSVSWHSITGLDSRSNMSLVCGGESYTLHSV